MTRKDVAHGQRRDPISGTVRLPAGNSGKIDMRPSRDSTEQGISTVNNYSNQSTSQYMKIKAHAYKSDFLVQPKQVKISPPSLKLRQ